MKKIFFGSFLILGISILGIRNKNEASQIKHLTKKTYHQNESDVANIHTQKIKLVRGPAQQNERQEESSPKISKIAEFRKIKEKNIKEKFEVDENFKGLSRGLILAPNVRAIRAEEYSPNLGTALLTQGKMVYFKPQSPIEEGWSNVVYDPRTDNFYPISAVLKVKRVSEDLRSDLLSKGLQEYYYLNSQKLLYLQSSHPKVLDLYQDLKSQGLSVELEVIYFTHQNR